MVKFKLSKKVIQLWNLPSVEDKEAALALVYLLSLMAGTITLPDAVYYGDWRWIGFQLAVVLAYIGSMRGLNQRVYLNLRQVGRGNCNPARRKYTKRRKSLRQLSQTESLEGA